MPLQIPNIIIIIIIIIIVVVVVAVVIIIIVIIIIIIIIIIVSVTVYIYMSTPAIHCSATVILFSCVFIMVAKSTKPLEMYRSIQ